MNLSAAQLLRMSRLLDDALALDPPARQRWLDALGPDDADLAPALREALTAGPRSSWMDSELPVLGAPGFAAEPALRCGDPVGPYQLIRELGCGGMARVWLARRADGAYERHVALKLPALGRARPDLAERFAVERDILAALEHPHIARMYDAGVTSNGLPYIALEFVDGAALDAWCARHRVGLRQRLQLVIQALDALQHAHERRILHRDLKPANILVTDSGQVRLLDFGVAKLLSADGDAPDPALTLRFGRAMTPAYASPEQLRGDTVGTASDIFSIGVMLYELLAGRLPLPLDRGESPTARAVRWESTRIVPPSRMALVGGADGQLDASALARLDRAVLKALELEPARRHRSAGRLADALRQVLGWAVPPASASARRRPSGLPAAQRRLATVVHLGPAGAAGQPMAAWLARHGGQVRTGLQGEALVQFTAAADALRAAVSLQQAARRRQSPWFHQPPALGLDLGEVSDRGSMLGGRAVRVAARLQRLALPGGIGLSAAVRAQLGSRPPSAIVPAGEARVHGLATPVAWFRVEVTRRDTGSPGTPRRDDTRPPARTARSNVPTAAAELLGRDAALADLQRELAQHRLVTVLGAGGIGKTRVAMEAARAWAGRCADGVWWVDLATVSGDGGLLPAIAAAVHLELAGEDPGVALLQGLAGLDLLLVLDNCEHLADSVAALVQRLLPAASGVRLLATSQLPLGVPGERLHRLEPLAVPPPGTDLAAARGHGAIALLEARAQAVQRGFALDERSLDGAIQLCRRLDGIALAIEMAATRLPLLGVQALLDRLESRFDLLRATTRSAPTRQQTLRATLDWSVGLLTPTERTLLCRLSVFVGSFRLDTASAVAAEPQDGEWAFIEALRSLVDKSLVQLEAGDPPRCRLLESVRLYAAQALQAAGESTATGQRHGRAMQALAQEIDEVFWTLPDEAFFPLYEPEVADLQLAFDRACREHAVEVVAATGSAFRLLSHERTSYLAERARKVAAHALVPLADGLSRARLWRWFCGFKAAEIPGLTRVAVATEAVAASRAIGHAAMMYEALWALAVELCRDGRQTEAVATARQARAQENPAWPARLLAVGAMFEGTVHLYDGDAVGYGRCARHALALCEQAGARREAAWQRHNLADAALMAGDHAQAIVLERRVIAELEALQERRNLCWPLVNLCAAYLMNGETEAALDCARRSWPHLLSMNTQWDVLDHLALIAARRGRCEDAARLLGMCDAWYRRSQRGVRQPNEARLVEAAAALAAAALGATAGARCRTEGDQASEAEALALAQSVLGGDVRNGAQAASGLAEATAISAVSAGSAGASP